MHFNENGIPGWDRSFDHNPLCFCGTRTFTPPEIHNGEMYEAHSADVWAMGLVFCCMLLGHLPYKDLDCLKARQLGCHTDCRKILDPVGFIVDSCLKIEMLLRPSAAELQLRDDYLPIALRRAQFVGMSTDELWPMLDHL